MNEEKFKQIILNFEKKRRIQPKTRTDEIKMPFHSEVKIKTIENNNNRKKMICVICTHRQTSRCQKLNRIDCATLVFSEVFEKGNVKYIFFFSFFNSLLMFVCFQQ